MLSHGNTDCAGCPVASDDDPGDMRLNQAGSIPSETPEKVALVTLGGLECFGLRAKGGTMARQGLFVQNGYKDEGSRWVQDSRSQTLALGMA